MAKEDWQLEQIADFFYLLVDRNDTTGKNILQKRFKKDINVLNELYDLIEKIDELGYSNGIDFAFNTKRFDTIKGTKFNLIEIRRLGKTWRVITYWCRKKKIFVMLDAFEAHKHKSMSEVLKQIEPLAQQVIRLIRDGE